MGQNIFWVVGTAFGMSRPTIWEKLPWEIFVNVFFLVFQQIFCSGLEKMHPTRSGELFEGIFFRFFFKNYAVEAARNGKSGKN